MSDYFQFRQFRVGHRLSGMKVGTDAVLLGAWVNLSGINTVLDIGTGTGIIALMLAQRTGGKAMIDAVEISDEAARDAQENFIRSPWSNSLRLIHQPLQQYTPAKPYDLLISNPPYFINSLKPPALSRQLARHTDDLSFDDLLQAAQRMVTRPAGRLAVILPEPESVIFQGKASRLALKLMRQCLFRTRAHKPVERVLMEFSFSDGHCLHEELCLYHDGNEWTPAYKALTRPFYLKD